MRFLLISLFFLAVGFGCTPKTYPMVYGHNDKQPIPQLYPGQCYLKTMTQAVFEVDTSLYWVYDDEQAKIYPHRITKVVLRPDFSRWEYAKYDDCESDAPQDCQVLCFRQYPGKTAILTEAIDTSVGNPKAVLVKTEKLIQTGGKQEWVVASCSLKSLNELPLEMNQTNCKLSAADKEVIDNQIIKLTKKYPGIRIDLGLHSSALLKGQAGIEFDQCRQDALTKYIKTQYDHIATISFQKYGNSHPKMKCDTVEDCGQKEHAINNWVSFQVVDAF